MKAFLTILGAVSVLSHAIAALAQVKLTPELQSEITGLIQGFGYNCPLAKTAWVIDEDVYGEVIKVACGSPDEPGVNPDLVFRITLRPDTLPIDRRIRVVPWHD